MGNATGPVQEELANQKQNSFINVERWLWPGEPEKMNSLEKTSEATLNQSFKEAPMAPPTNAYTTSARRNLTRLTSYLSHDHESQYKASTLDDEVSQTDVAVALGKWQMVSIVS